MRKIKFAWMPTKLLDGWTWLRFYKLYTSDRRTLAIRMVPFVEYEAGKRSELTL